MKFLAGFIGLLSLVVAILILNARPAAADPGCSLFGSGTPEDPYYCAGHCPLPQICRDVDDLPGNNHIDCQCWGDGGR